MVHAHVYKEIRITHRKTDTFHFGFEGQSIEVSSKLESLFSRRGLGDKYGVLFLRYMNLQKSLKSKKKENKKNLKNLNFLVSILF